MSHLYPVGATVICNVVAGHYNGKTDSFTVEAQMPPVGTSLQYRIKSETEMFRRVVAEHQLTAPDETPRMTPAPRELDYASEEE